MTTYASPRAHKRVTVGITLLWLLIHTFLWLDAGPRELYDSRLYAEAAQYLFQHGRLESWDQIFYIVPIFLIGLFETTFGASTIPFVVFQSIVSLFAALALTRVVVGYTGQPFAGLVAGVIFLISIDNIQWNMTVMTESLFRSFVVFLLLALSGFRGNMRGLVLIASSTGLVLMTRPAGVPVIGGVVVFLLRYYWMEGRLSRRRLYAIIAGVFVLGLAGATLMLQAWDLTDQHQRGNIVTYMDVLEGSPDYYPSLREDVNGVTFLDDSYPGIARVAHYFFWNPVHAFKVAGLKAWYLISGVRPYYSAYHNVYVALLYATMYILGYVGIRRSKMVPISSFVITVIVLNVLLVAISTVDWDNRFYIPMELGIVVIAAIGLAEVIRGVNFQRD